MPLSYCYSSYIDVLKRTQKMYSLEIHLFLLMENHFHMLASTPNENISAAMRYFMTESSRKLREGSRRINHIYGGRYSWSVVATEAYYTHVYKYILRNPVKAKVTKSVQSYKWSTVFNKKFEGHLNISPPNGHHSMLPDEPRQLLKWLNQPTTKEINEGIQKGLKRAQFDFPKNRYSRCQVDWRVGLPNC